MTHATATAYDKEALERIFLAGQGLPITPGRSFLSPLTPVQPFAPQLNPAFSSLYHIWLTFLAWAVYFVFLLRSGKTRLEFFKGILLMLSVVAFLDRSHRNPLKLA